MSLPTRMLCTLALAGLLAALSFNPARADDEQQSRLAFELNALRDAWLYGDDATAAVRLDTLREDNRLSGAFPRWYASLRAILALRKGDRAEALKVLQPVLDSSQDARNYLRDARVCLAYGAPDTALQIIRQGRARAPDSRALLRYQAGLQWLAGDYDGAVATYIEIIAADQRPNYPFVRPNSYRWSRNKPWNAKDNKPVGPTQQKYDEWGDPIENPDAYDPEPFSSLFTPLWWWPCDLPGLDRCVHELAGDAAQAKARADKLDDLLKAARDAQDALDTLRTGDENVRKGLEDKARKARWHALIDSRVVAESQLNASKWEAAEATARHGLELVPDDLALLDAQARAMGELGKAEEARTGPLARLRTLAGLSVSSYSLYGNGPSRQVSNRVFEPALTLYRVNKQAGQTQFDQMRTTFGDANRNQPVYPGLLGLWLVMHNEPELARKYLLEASRINGYESGKPLYNDAVFVEVALLSLGEATGAAAEQPDKNENKPKEKEKNVQPGKGKGGDDEGVEVAKLDASANPLLRKALRAGALIGAVPDTRQRLKELAGVELWGGSAGTGAVRGAAAIVPDGEKVVQQALYGMPAKVAANVPQKELDAFLSDDHATSKSLKHALETMADLIGQVRSSNNWQVRQSLSQKAGPVFGMVEARAILLRAKLMMDKPTSMDELSAWLSKWQKQIDLRTRLQSRPSDAYTRFVSARRKAGVPEVVHTGLLLDAARTLARNGAVKDAARLLWYNRDAMLGLETQNHLLALAAALARKAGDNVLALRCRMASTAEAPQRNGNSYLDPMLLLLELPDTRADLLEFGNADDLKTYIECQLVPFCDSPQMAMIEKTVPELKDARPTLVMRNSTRAGTDGIFASAMSSGNCYVILRNWYKMAVSDETLPLCQRFAGWVIASDLPVAGSSAHNGLATVSDTITAWAMLRMICKKQGAADPEASKQAERLGKLLDRTTGMPGQSGDDPWWDW